jgi:hypothetical protein
MLTRDRNLEAALENLQNPITATQRRWAQRDCSATAREYQIESQITARTTKLKKKSSCIQGSDIVPATGLLRLQPPTLLLPELRYEVEMLPILPPTADQARLKYAHPSFSKAA